MRRRLMGSFGRGQTSIAVEYVSGGQAAEDFDRAFESQDLEELVRLLPSEDPVHLLVEPKHSWAEDPQTIGALAGVLIALLASVVAAEDPDMKTRIMSAGAAQPLLQYLGCEEDDRVHVAVVALSYLADDCLQNAVAIHDAGALPLLMRHLAAPVPGLRGAAASTLRHVCVADEAFCEEFVSLGGLQGIVEQLDASLDHDELLLEVVWNLEDFTHDRFGHPTERYAALAVLHGAADRLESLQAVESEEVRAAADKLRASLLQAAKRCAIGGDGLRVAAEAAPMAAAG